METFVKKTNRVWLIKRGHALILWNSTYIETHIYTYTSVPFGKKNFKMDIYLKSHYLHKNCVISQNPSGKTFNSTE